MSALSAVGVLDELVFKFLSHYSSIVIIGLTSICSRLIIGLS